ncbi:DUF2770 family protein [Escherichia coli]
MRRLLHYLINNIREHLMLYLYLYLFLWGLLAIMDLIYVFYF